MEKKVSFLVHGSTTHFWVTTLRTPDYTIYLLDLLIWSRHSSIFIS